VGPGKRRRKGEKGQKKGRDERGRKEGRTERREKKRRGGRESGGREGRGGFTPQYLLTVGAYGHGLCHSIMTNKQVKFLTGPGILFGFGVY